MSHATKRIRQHLSALNYTGTMNGVGKTIGSLPAKAGIRVPPADKISDVNEPALAGDAVKQHKVTVKVKPKPKHVKVKRY